MEVRALGNGRFRVGDHTRQRLAYGVAAGDAIWVYLDGHAHVFETPTAARRRARHGHDGAGLTAPMPATVVLVHVVPGQVVARGDVLVMLEAMKMELVVKAPRDGRVKTVACRAGELVQPGVPLIELEPDAAPAADGATDA